MTADLFRAALIRILDRLVLVLEGYLHFKYAVSRPDFNWGLQKAADSSYRKIKTEEEKK